MKAILALDTTTNACSVALWNDGVIIASRYEEMIRGHAERLVPMVKEITDEAEYPVKAVNLVAVTVGPGAFTGVRIGLATARGFALSAGVPCQGLTTLEVIAASLPAASVRSLVAIDSKREDIYFQIFESDGVRCTDAAIAAPEQVSLIAAKHIPVGGHIILAGDGALAVSERLADIGIESEISCVQYPHASVLAELAAKRWLSGNPMMRAKPFYLRSPDAALPVSGGSLRP